MFKRKEKKKIYLEIHDTYLLITTLVKKKSEYILDSKTTQIVPLDKLEFKDGSVNNPSVITRFIKNYLETYNIGQTEAIVCLRNADKTDEGHQRFLTLQVSLLVAKAGLSISKIVHGPIMPWNNTSMLDGKIKQQELKAKNNLFKILTPPNYTNPQGWLSISLIVIAICATVMFRQYSNKQREVFELQEKLNLLSANNGDLSNKSKVLHNLKEANDSALAQMTTLEAKNISSHDKLLKIFAKHIPGDSWLKTLGKDESGTIKAVCNSRKASDVTTLLKRLSSEPELKNISLENLEASDNKKLFTFSLQAQLSDA